MKLSLPICAFLPVLAFGSLTLIGCGAAISTHDAADVPEVVAGPSIQGSVFGGHAPIVGAHVYLAQPSITGYGTAASSLLGVAQPAANGNAAFTPSNPPGYTLAANVSDPNVPVGAQYVTSDASGAFNLTGAYACTVGQPVFIYAYSGNIGTTSGTSTSTMSPLITQIVVSNASADQTPNGTATYLITVSAETLAVGQTVTIAGLTNEFTGINAAQTVLTAGLSSTTFEVKATNSYIDGNGVQHNTANGTYTATTGGGSTQYKENAGFGAVGTASYSTTSPTTNPATNNHAIVQLATLGNCPSSGNFSTQGNGALSYVYLNEVSTVAAAYTLKPFTLPNNNAWDIGSSGSTQALQGIANAASTAGQLYNIQGNTTQSSSGDGEGHLANYQTQGTNNVANQGNGVVPQATIDTLANILAACVDSTPPSGGGNSAACATLFANATATGLSQGAQPADTAAAAINIARYPAGNWSSTSDTPTSGYVTNLFNLPTGAVPYVPDLAAAPNDWTIAINYPYTAVSGYPGATNPLMYKAESIAFDSTGQSWITAQGTSAANATVSRWSPLGAQNSYASAGYIYGYVSIDGQDNAWTGNADSTSGIEEFSNNGVLTNTYGSGYNAAYTVIATGAETTGLSNGVFFIANTANTGNNYDLFAYGPSGSTVTGSPFSLTSAITGGNDVAHGAIDASGDLWLTSETPPYQVARVTQSGALAAGFPETTTDRQPEFPSIDIAGNAWIAIQEPSSRVIVVTPTGGITTLHPGTGGANPTGALMTSTFGSAVDGNGDVWFANRSGDYGSVSGTAGTNTIFLINHTNNLAISPATNYVPEAQYPATATSFTTMLNDSLNIAVDPSGNVWCTNYLGNAVVELVGAGTPTITPLSVAAASNKIGQKP